MQALSEAFLTAMFEGDVDALAAMLTDDVVHVSDGGPDHHAARRPVRGPHRVARLFVNITRRNFLPTDEFHSVVVNGQTGTYVVRDGEPFVLTVLDWRGDRVAEALSIVNPDKLRHFHEAWLQRRTLTPRPSRPRALETPHSTFGADVMGALRSRPMATLRDRVDRRDRELFVGRARELARFDALLAGDPVRLLYVSGAGGIGKSTLLRAMGRRAADAGYAVVTLDGRDLQPFPSVLNEALAPAMADEPHARRDRFLRDDQLARRVAPRGRHPRPARLHDRRVRFAATSVTRLVRGRLGRRVRIDGPRGAVDR